MKIYKIEIQRFRGIARLDWDVEGDFICLVGPGDSTKSTILDAIDLALSPRWNVPFDDTDFYDAKTDTPATITVTFGDVPDELKSDAKYGLLARGWTAAGKLRDEPEDEDEVVLSLQLRIDPSLEPSWSIVNDRNPEGKRITATDRERLGCARLGDFLDRHFAWGRGSVLSRLTGEADSLSSILAEAGRAARAALDAAPPEKLGKLNAAARSAKGAGAEFGVAATSDYHPRLDVQAVTVGVGGLSLHDGAVPLRRAGLGTRRLLAVAMQREVAKAGGVTLIDEVEHGLEPHRIRHLLRHLRATGSERRAGPVFMTTHSPVALGELNVSELRVVRLASDATRVLPVAPALQPIVLKASEAFFARKVLVCEGKTELGLCRRFDRWWTEKGRSFGHAGIALADGGGQEAPAVAKAFAELAYDVALLGDSDKPINPTRDELESAGARVFLWDGNAALEERIALDLPWDGVVAVLHRAMTLWSEQSVRDSLANQMGVAPAALAAQPAQWCGAAVAERDLRKYIGVTAKQKGWFKRVDLAEELAAIVIEHYESIKHTNLRAILESLRSWAHGDG